MAVNLILADWYCIESAELQYRLESACLERRWRAFSASKACFCDWSPWSQVMPEDYPPMEAREHRIIAELIEARGGS